MFASFTFPFSLLSQKWLRQCAGAAPVSTLGSGCVNKHLIQRPYFWSLLHRQTCFLMYLLGLYLFGLCFAQTLEQTKLSVPSTCEVGIKLSDLLSDRGRNRGGSAQCRDLLSAVPQFRPSGSGRRAVCAEQALGDSGLHGLCRLCVPCRLYVLCRLEVPQG